LPGVGPERAAQLARLGIHTVLDLLLHRPRRYEDRRQFLSIRELATDAAATVRGRIVAMGVKRFAKGRKSVFELILDDGTGRLHCRWWNLPYMQNYFRQGEDLMVFGKLSGLKPRAMDHPETESVEAGDEPSIHLNRIVPIYPLTEGLPQRWLRSLIWRTLQETLASLPDPRPFLADRGWPALNAAIAALHFPTERGNEELARQRLALDEFIDLQIAMQRRRRILEAGAPHRPCAGDNTLIKPFLRQLGFSLTPAQTRVLKEIRKELATGRPMRRLLQGDVGSGKTLVAACVALMVLESGFNAALMAPTEILAEQHFLNFKRWLSALDVRVELRTGSHRNRPNAAPGTSSQPCGLELTIGTHALIEDSVSLPKLGLAIVDEQHKFGVTQREDLVRKGNYPHLLVLTATPIPRTLGLTLYGDLDVSVLDELPPGRTPVKTYVREPDSLPKVWTFLRRKLSEGRQAYIIYPRVEEGTEKVKTVVNEWESMQKRLAPCTVGLLHGRLPSETKQSVMEQFRTGKLQVLLSTSLVEVGVDVANATIMIIENAEQFGLAQLHQLRGRIGRGAHESHCILIARNRTEDSEQRLRILEESTDGFRIAEVDMQLRGPGDLLGHDQSGMPPLRFGNLETDLRLIEEAREIVRSAGSATQ
jgi:ATP-dependent DNA helicase RecG